MLPSCGDFDDHRRACPGLTRVYQHPQGYELGTYTVLSSNVNGTRDRLKGATPKATEPR